MDGYELSSRFAAKLQRAIAEETDRLAAGVAESYHDYRHRVGRISGLRESLDLLNEARAATNDATMELMRT